MAGIVEVWDALIEHIEEVWPVEDRESEDDEVIGAVTFRIDAESHMGRKVYVFPASYTSEMATRTDDRNDFSYVIGVVERFREQGDPTNEWVRQRMRWCEWLINTIGDARGPRLLATNHLDGLWPEVSGIMTVSDVDEMTDKKLFMSALNITYREEG